ncbi:unnamed protein product [Rotaria sp. Silwood1]|nr:unnamed protein product [Rotaria sp. Silwood1]
MSNTDSFAIVHFPQNPKITAEDMVDIQFNTTTTNIKTADLTYEGHATKSSDLCGILGFVDDQGHIHLSSNFHLYTMRPKLTDFNIKLDDQNINNEDNKLNRTDLDEKFGTEKKRRSVHSKKRNTIEVNVLETAVSAAREQVRHTNNEQLNETIINNNISSFNDDEQMAIPKPNYDAQKPEDVFVLDDILNEHDLLLLNDKCSQIVDASKEDIQRWSKEGTYTAFVCDQMKKLPTDHTERVKCASKILYLHYLIAFFKRSMFKRLSGKPFPDDAPRALQDKALRTYAIANINERTRKQDNSDIDEDKENEKDDDSSPTSKEFSLRIPRVNLSDEENKQVSKRSSLVSSDDESKQEKIKPKKKRKSKKEKKTTMNTTKNSSPSQDKDKQTTTNDDTKNLSPSQDKDEQTTTNDDTKKSSSSQDKDEQTTTNDDTKNLSPSQDKDKQTTTNDDTKKSSQRKSKSDQAQARIEHLKKLLRISGIRFIIKKNELDEFRSNKAKIDYLKSLFDKAGYTGNLSIKECGKFRKKRDTEKELLEIQANAVHVKGHMKGGRTLRGEGRNTNEIDTSTKRKRTASSEIEDDEQNIEDKSSDNERTTVKKRRIMKMEASPEVSENE